TNTRFRSLAPPPPNRPLPPIPTAEQEEEAQRRASPTILTTGNTNNQSMIATPQRKPPQPMEGSKPMNQTLQRRSPSMLNTTLNSSLTVQQISIPTQTNRRPVPRMGTKSHPRGAQTPLGSCENGIGSRLSPNLPECSTHSSSSSSSGCEDSTLGSRRINSEEYMKITSNPYLFNVNP
ncbi:unnamed protein product, partial [Hymenolepis diminuta]